MSKKKKKLYCYVQIAITAPDSPVIFILLLLELIICKITHINYCS